MAALSHDALAYLAYVTGDDEVTSSDVCTDCARRVMAKVGKGGEALRHDNVAKLLYDNFQSWPDIQDGLYNLTISMLDGQVWQHGLVIQKSGFDMFIYQGWVGRYRLAQWLDPHNSAAIPPECFDSFSPASAHFDVDNMHQWLKKLNSLHDAYGDEVATFEALCHVMFGVTFGRMDKFALRAGMEQGYPLNFDWKFKFLKTVKELV